MTISRPPDPNASPSWWVGVAQRSLRGPADLVQVFLDAVLVVCSFTIMLVLRYELLVPEDGWSGLLRFLPVAVVLQVAVNRLVGVYGPVWQHASILEAKRILIAGGVTTTLLLAYVLIGARHVPLSVAVTGGLVATGLMGVVRFQSRLFAFRRRGSTDQRARVLVVGAGASGGALLRELARKDAPDIEVVALLDDDPRKVGRWVGSVPIVGGSDQLVEVGRACGVDQVLLAIPSADSTLIRAVADATAELGARLKVLPSVTELMDAEPQLRDVRDLSINDLLGRAPVDTDLDGVRRLIRGRRVLVTGGGGSIGSEIVRQVAEYAPASLHVLDRDETHLFDAMAAIGGRGEAVLLDVRDRARVRQLFLDTRPEIVFHAAANKHVPLLEDHPSEAAATNVLGTANLVAAARETDVAHLVFISTDKAVRPSSLMGASKRIGEQLVFAGAVGGDGGSNGVGTAAAPAAGPAVRTAAAPAAGPAARTAADVEGDGTRAWCAVRFGNVLGSRGSVVPTFMRQIQEGGPVTLTHPDMTRFFMSIPEAVQLVLQASSLAQDREVFMLEMGEPVRIMDLARRMISLAGLRLDRDIAIEVTGLRPGEKLTEELHTPDERPEPTVHPKVLRLHPTNPPTSRLQQLVERIAIGIEDRDDARIRDLLMTAIVQERSRVTSLGNGAPTEGEVVGAGAHEPRVSGHTALAEGGHGR